MNDEFFKQAFESKRVLADKLNNINPDDNYLFRDAIIAAIRAEMAAIDSLIEKALATKPKENFLA